MTQIIYDHSVADVQLVWSYLAGAAVWVEFLSKGLKWRTEQKNNFHVLLYAWLNQDPSIKHSCQYFSFLGVFDPLLLQRKLFKTHLVRIVQKQV